MPLDQDIRWQQRFNNFQRAFLLLREAMKRDIDSFNQLEKISPKAVIRQAQQSKYINDAETWLKMVGDRNLMSHTYDIKKFEAVIRTIESDYLPMLDEWYLELLGEQC